MDSARRPRRPVIGRELAPAGGKSDITQGYVSDKQLAPYTSELLNRSREYSLLNNRGIGDLRLVESIRLDEQVKTCMQQRAAWQISADMTVTPGGERRIDRLAADHIRQQLEQLQWDLTTQRHLEGLLYGYSATELIYGRDTDGRVIIDALKVRNRRRFRFMPNGEIRLLTHQNMNPGEPLAPKKFWVTKFGGDNDDAPYGQGLFEWLYWPVFFKKHGVKYWLKFLQKFGRPTAVGKHPPNATDDEIDSLADVALSVFDYDAVTIPHTQLIELLEASRSGTADYATLHEVMNRLITKVILSQTMTTEDGASLSQARVHEDVVQALAKSDADLLCSSFNAGPVRWLTDWNFPGAAYPKVWRDLDPPEDLTQKIEVDRTAYDMGFPRSQEYMASTYGDGFAEGDGGQPSGINGVQLESLIKIMQQVSSGEISAAAGRALAVIAIPSLDEQRAAEVIEEPEPEPESAPPQLQQQPPLRGTGRPPQRRTQSLAATNATRSTAGPTK